MPAVAGFTFISLALPAPLVFTERPTGVPSMLKLMGFPLRPGLRSASSSTRAPYAMLVGMTVTVTVTVAWLTVSAPVPDEVA